MYFIPHMLAYVGIFFVDLKENCIAIIVRGIAKIRKLND